MSIPLPDRHPPFFYNVLNGACILLAIAAVYLYFNSAGIDIRRSPKIAGRIESAYLTSCVIPGVRSTLPKRVFAFKLDQSSQTLGVYRRSREYADLQGSLNVGDEVTVYYRPSSARVDLDVFQIEKGGAIVLNYEIYRHHSLVISYGLGGAAVVVFLVGQFFLWDAKKQRT